MSRGICVQGNLHVRARVGLGVSSKAITYGVSSGEAKSQN